MENVPTSRLNCIGNMFICLALDTHLDYMKDLPNNARKESQELEMFKLFLLFSENKQNS